MRSHRGLERDSGVDTAAARNIDEDRRGQKLGERRANELLVALGRRLIGLSGAGQAIAAAGDAGERGEAPPFSHTQTGETQRKMELDVRLSEIGRGTHAGHNYTAPSTC